MATWQKINLSQFFPSGIDSIVSSVSSTASAASDIISALVDILNQFEAFLIGYTDPMIALALALETEITNFIGDLRTAGVYLLPFAPLNLNDRQGSTGAISLINTSFDDLADSNRPTFSPSSQMVGYVFMVGSLDLPGLYTTFLSKAGSLFNLGELRDWEWTVNPGPDYVPPRVIRSANCRYPDWKRKTVGEVFPPYDKLLAEMEGAISKFSPGASLTTFFSSFITTVNLKVQILDELAAELEFLADELEALLQIPNVYFIKIEAAGVLDFQTKLAAATNRPSYQEGTHYVAGVVALAGGPDVAVLESLLG